MRKYQDSVHEIKVIVNPDVLKRLKEEDEELLVELERRYAGRLIFRGDPTYHHEKFTITDANTRGGTEALGLFHAEVKSLENACNCRSYARIAQQLGKNDVSLRDEPGDSMQAT